THADGTRFSLDINLDVNSGGSLATALDTINTNLQASGDSNLKSIFAVKEQMADGTWGVRFVGNDAFSVNINADARQVLSGCSGHDKLVNADKSDGGSFVDISTQGAAQHAVQALGSAVTALGTAQAVVGKGQNQFTYAVNLAQSQLSNFAAAESRIR